MSSEKNLILAFDPGRDKTGFALLNFDGELIFSGIFPSEGRGEFFDMILNEKNIEEFLIENSQRANKKFLSRIKFLAVGNGTHGKEFYENVKNKFSFEIKIIDEKNTTLEARKLYWKIHKPGFFARLLPEGLRVPARVLDDLAAYAIGLRAIH
ncbi:MAG: hypothetical protein IKN30_06030 [Synergistaceae bacterium]|nr:hypothetical protein [Synergistaceae bacterium]